MSSQMSRLASLSEHKTNGRKCQEPEHTLQNEDLITAPKSKSILTTFHMGIVFILLGFLMIFSSMIPSRFIKADWSQLLGIGISVIFIGLFLMMVNRFITSREKVQQGSFEKQRLKQGLN